MACTPLVSKASGVKSGSTGCYLAQSIIGGQYDKVNDSPESIASPALTTNWINALISSALELCRSLAAVKTKIIHYTAKADMFHSKVTPSTPQKWT